MLVDRGMVSEADRDALLGDLAEVERDLREERFAFETGDEYIHMAIERRLSTNGESSRSHGR